MWQRTAISGKYPGKLMPDSSHGSEYVVDTYIVFLLEGASSHLTTEKIRPQETIVFILKTLIQWCYTENLLVTKSKITAPLLISF